MALTEKEAGALATLSIFVILGLASLILSIKIGVIHFYQNMFWISLFVLTPLFFILFIVFLVWGFSKENTQPDYLGYYSEEFFEKPIIFIFAVGFLLLCLLFFLFTPYCYERGYSDRALQDLAGYESQLQSIQELQSIVTGEIIWDITNQALDDVVASSCKESRYSCEQIKQSVQIYKEIKGAKDNADEIADFLGFAEKVKEVIN